MPALNPLSAADDPIASFVYDGDGKRVKSVINGVTTYFVGNYYEVVKTDTSTQVNKYYYAGPASGQRIAMRQDGILSYLLTDHLGSTSLVTDASGNVTSELRYTAWGEVRYQAGITPTNYTYTGQYSYASDFGLSFYNARWYDSSLGRFAQADTIVPGGVQGYDRYAYVANNPLRYTDPTGHMCSDPEDPTPSCDGADNVGEVSHGGGGLTNDDGYVGDEDNWPDDPQWDYYPALIEWETDSTDILFDPWAGASYEQASTDPDIYYGQIYEYRRLSWLAYAEAGLDPRLIVDNAILYGADNPLTDKQASDLAGSLTLRKGWRPYSEFLTALGLDPGHITNYEPRFMEGLMVAKKGVLNDVKDTWRLTMADPLMAEMRQFLIQRKPGFTP